VRRSISKAKKSLIGLFYFLQGLGNLVLGLFYIRVDVSYGGSGGAAAGMEILIKSSLVFGSLFSFGAVLALCFEFKTLTKFCGVVSSLVFGLFYGAIGLLLSSVIRSQFSLQTAGWLLLSVVLVILNLVAILSLIIIVSDKVASAV